MSAKVKNAPPAEQAPGDEYAGQGGSYVVDPETGRRVLVERTMERGEGAPQADKE